MIPYTQFNNDRDNYSITAGRIKSNLVNNLSLESSNNIILNSNLIDINSKDNYNSSILRFNTPNNNSVSVSVPNYLDISYNIILPNSIGSKNQVLTTDGSGNTSWREKLTSDLDYVFQGQQLSNLLTNIAEIQTPSVMSLTRRTTRNFDPTRSLTYTTEYNNLIIEGESGIIRDPQYIIEFTPISVNQKIILSLKINYIANAQANKTISFYIYKGNSNVGENLITVENGTLLYENNNLGSSNGIDKRGIFSTVIYDTVIERRQTKYKLYYKISNLNNTDIPYNQGILGYNTIDNTLSNYNLFSIQQYQNTDFYNLKYIETDKLITNTTTNYNRYIDTNYSILLSATVNNPNVLLTIKVNYLISIGPEESISFFIYRGNSYIDINTDTIIDGVLISQDLNFGSNYAIEVNDIYHTIVHDKFIIEGNNSNNIKYKLYYKINKNIINDNDIQNIPRGIIGSDNINSINNNTLSILEYKLNKNVEIAVIDGEDLLTSLTTKTNQYIDPNYSINILPLSINQNVILTIKVNYIISIDYDESISFFVYRGNSYIDVNTNTIMGGELISQDLNIGSSMAISNRSIYYTTLFDNLNSLIEYKYKLYYKINSNNNTNIYNQGILGYNLNDPSISNYNIIMVEQYNQSQDSYSILNNNNEANFSQVNIDSLKINQNIDLLETKIDILNSYSQNNVYYNSINKSLTYINKLVFSCYINSNILLTPQGTYNIINSFNINYNYDNLVYTSNSITIKYTGSYIIKFNCACYINNNSKGSYYINIRKNQENNNILAIANINDNYNFIGINSNYNNLMSCNLERILYLTENDKISFIIKRNYINNLNNLIKTYSGEISITRL